MCIFLDGHHETLTNTALIRLCYVIADVKSIVGGLIQSFSNCASGIRHGQDNKPETLKQHMVRQGVLRIYCKLLCNKLFSVLGTSRVISVLHATSFRFNQCRDLNRNRGNVLLLRDITAYDPYNFGLLRVRRVHSNRKLKHFDISSEVKELRSSSVNTAIALKNENSVQAPSKIYKSRRLSKYIDLVALVSRYLQNYENKQGKYNGIINILRSPEFLAACYQKIRGKPANISPGIVKESLDGITWD